MGIESLGSPENSAPEITRTSHANTQLCLKENLELALSPDYDGARDGSIVDTLGRSIMVGADSEGRWALGCLQAGCEARCIMVQDRDRLVVLDKRMLGRCAQLY